ncbi:hypothetical protein NEDG_01866 [Nematocida displodere]|uniref:RING-type domain-containing protein n=1 Tax=Nematocida displodere TaxID=1805483 RepID=A0A177EIY9_9MICR|nr:hypothetical protein NEDG_01866 [Nematocida displodere]
MNIPRRWCALLLFGGSFCFSRSDSVAVTSSEEEYQVLPMALVEGLDDGCTAGPVDTPSGKWLGLVTKAGCSLSRKHRTLLELGASGMLVETGDADTNPTLSHQSFHVVPVNKALYRMLTTLFVSKSTPAQKVFPTVKVLLPVAKPLPLLQVAYVIFLVIMIFIFPMLFERLEDAPLKLVRPRELSTLARTSFSECQKKYEECPICFDRFAPSALVRTLHCTHYFHTECIDPWLLSRSSRCPVCNHELLFS